MAYMFNDPTVKERRFIMKDSDYLQVGDGLQFAKMAYTICLEAARTMGWDPKACPCINRKSLEVRPWNLVKSAALSEILCGSGLDRGADWRIATKEEWTAHEAKRLQDVREMARRKLRYEKGAVEQLAGQQEFQRMLDAMDSEQEAAEISADDIAVIEAKLAKLKAEKAKGKEKKQ